MVAIFRIAGLVLILLGIGMIVGAAEAHVVAVAYVGIFLTFIGLIISILMLFKKPSSSTSSQPQSINSPFG